MTTDDANGDEYANVDLRPALDSLQVLSRRLHQIDGREIPPKQMGRARSAELAELTKELLFLTHLCDRVKVQVMDEYYVARGITEHIDGAV